ncbi:MAG: Nre family DNA repair protein [Thermoplasmata archaeon]|nr:Nre family DNA repair protein [Thermoplasmata archaeon]
MTGGWISEHRNTEAEFSSIAGEVSGGSNAALCSVCKGSRLLCGKDRCPVVTRYHAHLKAQVRFSENMAGSSPPSVFVGRAGYPKVYVGPMVPPIMGNTEIMDMPEAWIGKSIDDILGYRMNLVRGMTAVDIHNVENGGRIVDQTRELAMGHGTADTEAVFHRRPMGRLTFDDSTQPFGPSAPLKAFDINSIKIDQRIDRAYSDTDLLAAEAVKDLYRNGIMLSRLQRAFSVGAFGIGRNRKFVPTRWSITAIDDMLGKDLLQKTRDAPVITDFEVYETESLDNRWAVLMMPCTWRYELIEAWYPRSVWNPYGQGIEIISDWEFFKPRKTYAKIGGCYYSARLAVNENLTARNRQAGVVIFREAHAGYIMPVGVWNVRENVRDAVKKVPRKFATLSEALAYIQTKMDIPMARWIKTSGILKDMLHQRRIEDYLGRHIEPDLEERHEYQGSEGQHSIEPV